MGELDVQLQWSRSRQKRLLAEMEALDLDLAIVTRTPHVQWLTGPRYGPWFHPAAALRRNGHVILVSPDRPADVAAADETLAYEAKWCSTMRSDQRQASSTVLLEALKRHPKPRRVGVEFSSFPPHISQTLEAEFVDLEPAIYRLRRSKDPDELARIRKAIAGTARMVERAREIVEPGVNELTVFNELQAAAVSEFGEALTGTGNDYASGERGGPARDRAAEEGELYILDLGPAFRGYFADNCRTLAVNRRPTDAQQAAWEKIIEVFAIVERRARPGQSCHGLYDEVKAHLDEYMPGSFSHHLGHGIGLEPHEGPHVNPKWDDTFEVGDVFTIEPGLYGPELRAGIRLEENYLVTEEGVELLTNFPLELVV